MGGGIYIEKNLISMKNTITLNEQQLRKVIEESVRQVLNEIGDTHRGQFMLGRVASKNFIKNPEIANDAWARRKQPFSVGDDFDRGNCRQFEKDAKHHGADHKMGFDYAVTRGRDMKKLGRRLIDFIENSLLQDVVDYETGNQTGTPESGFPFAFDKFENEVLGYKCSQRTKKDLEKIYNEWLFFNGGPLEVQYDNGEY